MTLENLGNEASSFIEVDLIELIDNPYITITNGSGVINNLSDGSNAFIDLSFYVSNSAPYGHGFALQLELSSDENNSSSTLNFTVEALVESFENNSTELKNAKNENWGLRISKRKILRKIVFGFKTENCKNS